MSRKLYCKNIACYDIDKNEILDMKLIPNYILMNPSNARFNQWVKLRYSAVTNTYSRMLRGAVFGQGNFGFLKDSNTGDILGMSPLYDFDHALDDCKESINLVLLRPLLDLNNQAWKDEALRIAKVAMNFSNSIFAMRAEHLYTKLYE